MKHNKDARYAGIVIAEEGPWLKVRRLKLADGYEPFIMNKNFFFAYPNMIEELKKTED